MARRSFKEAVQATPDIADAYKSGISALGSYSKKVVVPNKRLFGGSVDIDVATKTLYPNDSRWDYAFDYSGETFFIEIHPANTVETRIVLNKLKWLKHWLQSKAPELDEIKSTKLHPFYWVEKNDEIFYWSPPL